MKKTTSEQKEQIELGKKLQAFYESGYVNKKQALLFSFYKGLATGFGAFLGGTIVVGIVLGILSRFDQLPFIDHIINAISK